MDKVIWGLGLMKYPNGIQITVRTGCMIHEEGILVEGLGEDYHNPYEYSPFLFMDAIFED